MKIDAHLITRCGLTGAVAALTLALSGGFSSAAEMGVTPSSDAARQVYPSPTREEPESELAPVKAELSEPPGFSSNHRQERRTISEFAARTETSLGGGAYESRPTATTTVDYSPAPPRAREELQENYPREDRPRRHGLLYRLFHRD